MRKHELAAMRDTYELSDGSVIGLSLKQAAAWAWNNKDRWNTQGIFLNLHDGELPILVDSDIRDFLNFREEEAKDDVTVLREALRQVNDKVDRLMFEASTRIEGLEKELAALREGKLK